MKKRILCILLTLAMLVIPLCPNSFATDDGDDWNEWLYSIDREGNVTLKEYLGSKTDLIIPKKIQGHDVTEIYVSVGSPNFSTKTLTIPDSLKYVVPSYYDYALRNRAEVDFMYPTQDYHKLERINVDTNNPYFSNDDQGILYNKDKTELIWCPPGKQGHVIVPSSVKIIDSFAFYNSKINSIDLPMGLETIQGAAFFRCPNLKSLYIPDSVDLTPRDGEYPGSYDKYFFAGLTGLEYIHIPRPAVDYNFEHYDSDTGNVHLSNLMDLTLYWLGKENRHLKDIDFDMSDGKYVKDDHGIIYNGDKTQIIFIPPMDDGIVHIPETVQTLYADDSRYELPWFSGNGNIAFDVDENNPYLKADDQGLLYRKNVDGIPGNDIRCCIPSGKKTVELSDKSSLDVLINSSLIDFLSDNFDTIIISKTCTDTDLDLSSLGNFAFMQLCGYSFKGFVVDENNPYFSSDSQGFLFNKDKTAMLATPRCADTLVITKEYLELGQNDNSIPLSNPDPDLSGFLSAFSYTNIKNVVFEDGITDIPDGIFGFCTGLESVTLPDSVKTIGDGAFSSCINLKSINIPDGVTEIGAGAFADCINLKSIEIPSSVTTISPYAFKRCTGLKNVKILGKGTVQNAPRKMMMARARAAAPTNELQILDYAFVGCKNISEMVLPNRVSNIGESTFCGCDGLSSITVANPTCQIGEYAIPTAAVIHAHEDSTAKQYSNVNGNDVVIEPHEYRETIIPPTCLLDGYTLHECTYCDDKFIDNEIAASDEYHIFDDGEVTKQPTCTEAGVMTYTCVNCQTTKTEGIKTIEHTYDDGEVTKQPTCTEAGVMTYTCVNCTTTKTEEIKALDHIDENNDSVCDRCDTVLECNCLCHKMFTGNKYVAKLYKVIYHIVRVFWKLFGINRTCACGAYHY